MALVTQENAVIKPPAVEVAKIEVPKTALAKPKPVAKGRAPRTLADPTDRALKMLCYGPTGTGKTLVLSAFLEAGLDVLAVSTDFGGEGFTSVEADLKERGKAELLAHCTMFDLRTYDEVEDFCFNPKGFWPEIYEKDFDLLFLDGFSSFQLTLLDDKIMSFQAQGNNAGDAREAGLWSNQQDWGAVKKGTTKILDRYLRMKNEQTGKNWHKFVTCLENAKPKEDKLTGETRIGPHLQGAGASLIEPSFDLIFRTRKKKGEEGGKRFIRYDYEFNSVRALTKTRGLKLPDTADANFLPIWQSICAQKGIPAGKA